jgi:hypothetical protein
MTNGLDDKPPRLLTRWFWAMMALAVTSFLAAAAVVSFGLRHHAGVAPSLARPAPLAAGARGAKTATPDSPHGPP